MRAPTSSSSSCRFRDTVEAHADAEEREVLSLLDQHRARHELQMMDVAFTAVPLVAPTLTRTASHRRARPATW